MRDTVLLSSSLHSSISSTLPKSELKSINCCIPCQFTSETNKTSIYFCQHLNYILQPQHFAQVWSLLRELWHPQPIIWLLWSCDMQAVWLWAPVCGMMKTLVLLSLQWSISPLRVRLDINHHHGKISFATNWHNSCDKNTACSPYEIGTHRL